MKKSLKLAVAASVLTAPAMAANMENPLYLPTQGQIYSKTSAGLMLKVADDSMAHQIKNHDGKTEFPILRIQEDLGYGITDRLTVRGAFAYTQDDDINRKGLNHGRLGLIYRALETTDDIVLDIYADAHLGGVSRMYGAYTTTGFQYDNYSNGRWGFDVGMRFGKTWSKLTTSAFVEVLQTFGNSNNEIDISGLTAGNLGAQGAAAALPITALGIPSEISVSLKSTTEVNAGLNAFYQLDDRWSFGAGFKYQHHATNGVESLKTELSVLNFLNATGQQEMATMLEAGVDKFIDQLEDMQDGFDEYVVTLSVANQLTDYVQVALYGEYTFDDAEVMSQNGTDVKAEVGVRLNVQF